MRRSLCWRRATSTRTVYKLVQFAIREAVAARSLDEILAARDTIDAQVRAFVSGRVAALGIEIGEIGVKDVILPGDVRELLNKVVEAERTAKANLIRSQEETASTRSLLNTARLMEDNPILQRLKELEALEKARRKGRSHRPPHGLGRLRRAADEPPEGRSRGRQEGGEVSLPRCQTLWV